MFLALKEMKRAKARFGLLIAAIALLVFLILFQQSLQNGLVTGFIGAIRNQNTPVLVYAVDGQRVIQGSVITPDQEALVRPPTASARSAASGRARSPGQPSGRRDVRHDDHRLRARRRRRRASARRPPSSRADSRRPTGEAVASDADVENGYGSAR